MTDFNPNEQRVLEFEATLRQTGLHKENAHQGDRVKAFAMGLAVGVREDLWSPLFRVYDIPEEGEYWEGLGHPNYQERLLFYLNHFWRRTHPQAAFMLTFGYLQRAGEQDYLLTDKALDLLRQPAGDVRVFISYKRSVSSLQALMLSQWLWRLGIENFLDVDSIHAGGELGSQLEEAIRTRSHFICLLGAAAGENTLQSTYVRREIATARRFQRVCIPFFQHDWQPPGGAPPETAVLELLERPGVEVAAVANAGQVAQAYADALSRLLIHLNRSRV